MSNRIFGTEKVDNIIGLKDQTVYDKIDVYIDVNNPNNIWGMVYYTEYIKRKPVQKQEIVKFDNYQTMINYVRTNFDGYELDHPIDIERKKIFLHNINYCNVEYFYHEGKPELNYIEVSFFEYENDHFVKRRIKLPKEYEELFVNVLKVSKNVDKLDSRFHRDVDVYESRAIERRETIKSLVFPIEEFFHMAGEKIKQIHLHKEKILKGLKIAVSTAALVTILGGGYKLVTENEFNSDYIIQSNPIRSVQDIGMYFNKGKVGIIIEKLIEGKYYDVSAEEIDQALEYIRSLDDKNYDQNASFTLFSYNDYFQYKVAFDDGIDYAKTTEVLYKIDTLYKESVKIVDGKPVINQDRAKKYLDYVCSLTFMYDTYHTDRVKSYYTGGNNQSLISPYATSGEIEAYDKFPPILKFIILNQMKGLLQRVDYKVDQKPLYYFKGTDKYDLLTEATKRIDTVTNNMYYECGYNRGNSR